MAKPQKDLSKNWLVSSMEKGGKYQDYYDYVKPTLGGGYAYMGPVFTFSKDNDMSYKRFISILLICAFLMLGACISSGLLYITGMNTPWQVAPYGLEVLLSCMTFWAVVRLAFTKQPIKIFNMRPTAEAIPKRSRLTMLCAAVGLAAIAFYVFMNGWDGREKVIPTLLYMAARTVVALSSGLIFRLSANNVWDEENINEGEDEDDEEEEDDAPAKAEPAAEDASDEDEEDPEGETGASDATE